METVQPGEKQLGIGWGGFVAGIVAVIACFALSSVLLGVVLVFVAPDLIDGLANSELSGASGLILLLTSFVGAMIGLWLAVSVILRRPYQLVTWSAWPKTWKLLWRFTLAYAVLIFGLSALAAATGGVIPNIAFADWIRWLPVFVVLVFIQVTAEELFFRGYLQRILIDWTSNRLIWMLIPSLLFGSLHFQPSVFGENAWLIVLTTFLFGMVAAELTYRSGSIGPAIALHFVNNLNAMLVTEMDGGIGGFALFKTPYTAADTEAVRGALLQGCAFFVVLFVVIWIFWPKPKTDG
ncbi:MAG: CPBP family intramembrane glutamic endopeptidase [Pseudomonadota bacterium]